VRIPCAQDKKQAMTFSTKRSHALPCLKKQNGLRKPEPTTNVKEQSPHPAGGGGRGRKGHKAENTSCASLKQRNLTKDCPNYKDKARWSVIEMKRRLWNKRRAHWPWCNARKVPSGDSAHWVTNGKKRPRANRRKPAQKGGAWSAPLCGRGKANLWVSQRKPNAQTIKKDNIPPHDAHVNEQKLD